MTSNVIPYWKTETVEAMTAFRYKEGFDRGAGECVSLSALYAAALFVVGSIPLEKIFLIATPLHSQNFINVHEGVLTNNRRIVTKNMWFNGTSLSAKARRALENENVTMVTHISGYIHAIYPEATIDPKAYQEFAVSLKKYLCTDISTGIFLNFLRYDMSFKKCFQYIHSFHGHDHYIALEKVFEYEHGSKNNFSEKSRQALLTEIETEEFSLSPLEGRMILNNVESFLSDNKNLTFENFREYFLKQATETKCKNYDNIQLMFEEMGKFICVQPKLPQAEKDFVAKNILKIDSEQSREEIVSYIFDHAEQNEVAQLALYTYRQMDRIDWKPFIKAAFERNPVSLEDLKNKTIDEVYKILLALSGRSVYDGQRLAQPDEVWNFKQGDGVEKAILLGNFIVHQSKAKKMNLIVDQKDVVLENGNDKYIFTSEKGLSKKEATRKEKSYKLKNGTVMSSKTMQK